MVLNGLHVGSAEERSVTDLAYAVPDLQLRQLRAMVLVDILVDQVQVLHGASGSKCPCLDPDHPNQSIGSGTYDGPL